MDRVGRRRLFSSSRHGRRRKLRNLGLIVAFGAVGGLIIGLVLWAVNTPSNPGQRKFQVSPDQPGFRR